MNLRRIVVATPYLDEINRIERDYMQARGFDLPDIQGLNLRSDAEMARVTPDYLKTFALEIDRPDAEAIFVSCSGLRTIEVIEDIEQTAGKPASAATRRCSGTASDWPASTTVSTGWADCCENIERQRHPVFRSPIHSAA